MGLLSGITDAIGLTDSKAGMGELGQSQAMMAQIVEQVKALKIPDYEKMRIVEGELLKLQDAGMIQPEVVQTAMKGIANDPGLLQIDERLMGTRRALEDIAGQGISPEVRAMLETELDRSAGTAQAQQDSILQGAAQRGNLDSGASLNAQMMSGQQAAERNRRTALESAAQMSSSKRGALGDLSNLDQSMGNQMFQRQQSEKGAIDQFNLANASNRMQAQQANLGIKHADTQAENQRRLGNKEIDAGIPQYQAETQKLGALTGAQQNYASTLANVGSGKQKAQADQFGSLANLGMGIGQIAMFSDERVKENKKELDVSDVDEMLDKVKGMKYNYIGEDEPVEGVMAQDLEKSKLGKSMVGENELGVKMVNTNKAASSALAGVASVNKRLRRLEKLLGGIDE